MSRFSVASELASALGLKGYTGVVAPGVHGGVQLLAHGAELLRASSDLDGLLVVGVDEWSDLLAAMYGALKLLDDCIKPYDPSANGTVGGEGAAALLLVRSNVNTRPQSWDVSAVPVSQATLESRPTRKVTPMREQCHRQLSGQGSVLTISASRWGRAVDGQSTIVAKSQQ